MLHAPLPILLTVTVVTGFLMSILRGIYAKRYDMDGPLLWSFNFLQNFACLLGIVMIYLLSGSSFQFSLFSVSLGAAMAACNVISVYASLKAFALGAFSYTTVVIGLSAVIPTLSGLVFGESISPTQYVGIALMVVCILLSPEKSEDRKQAVNGKWLLWCAAAFVSSGGFGVIQKAHQKSSHAAEMPALLITGFALASLFALCMMGRYRLPAETTAKAGKGLVAIPLLCGISFAFPHTINLVLAGVLPAVIMFPIVNLCPMMLSMLYAFLFMKERLSVSQWAGIAVGIFSTVFVSGVIVF